MTTPSPRTQPDDVDAERLAQARARSDGRGQVVAAAGLAGLAGLTVVVMGRADPVLMPRALQVLVAGLLGVAPLVLLAGAWKMVFGISLHRLTRNRRVHALAGFAAALAAGALSWCWYRLVSGE